MCFYQSGKALHSTMSGRSSPVAAVSDDGWWDVDPWDLVPTDLEPTGLMPAEQLWTPAELDEMTYINALLTYAENLSSCSTPRRANTPTSQPTQQ